jgi:hypothetical protein
MATVSTLAGLALAELVVRRTTTERVLLRWDADDDEWKWLWRRIPMPQRNPRIEPHPSLGWVGRPNYQGPAFTLNARGQRDPHLHDYAKPDGESRVVVLGDSFTFGSFPREFTLPDSAVYTARLERCLGIPVINLASDGYAVDQLLLSLREEGVRYQPDLVIAAVFEDNLRRSLLGFRDYYKPRFVLEGGGVVLTGVPVPPLAVAESLARPDVPTLYLPSLVEHGVRWLVERLAPLGALTLDRLNWALLDAMRADADSAGARLLVVAIPDDTYRDEVRRTERILAAWAERSGTPFLDLRTVFEPLPPGDEDRLYIGHLTPFGHEVMTAALLEAIRRYGLLPGLPAPPPARCP